MSGRRVWRHGPTVHTRHPWGCAPSYNRHITNNPSCLYCSLHVKSSFVRLFSFYPIDAICIDLTNVLSSLLINYLFIPSEGEKHLAVLFHTNLCKSISQLLLEIWSILLDLTDWICDIKEKVTLLSCIISNQAVGECVCGPTWHGSGWCQGTAGAGWSCMWRQPPGRMCRLHTLCDSSWPSPV